MSLYFVCTIDGDWDEYFFSKLAVEKRRPKKSTLIKLIKNEIKVASIINGRILHFVHTSFVSNGFFLKPEFISLWKEIERKGGSVGIHCHKEDLYVDGNLSDPDDMEKAIERLTKELRKNGLNPISYRGGYLTFCKKNIPFLEKNSLFLDFSCDSNRHLWHDGELVADWRGAPDNYYRMSYEDHRKPGKSKVFEIPLGKSEKDALYIDITSLKNIWKAARALHRKDKEEKGDIIVSVLTHTYEFSSFRKLLKIKLALLICKIYGKFINDREALEVIKTTKEGKSI
jgi:hypothetical protein